MNTWNVLFTVSTPLHEPYTQTFVENSIISDLKTKCRPFEQVGPHAKCAMADWIYGTQSPKLFIRTYKRRGAIASFEPQSIPIPIQQETCELRNRDPDFS